MAMGDITSSGIPRPSAGIKLLQSVDKQTSNKFLYTVTLLCLFDLNDAANKNQTLLSEFASLVGLLKVILAGMDRRTRFNRFGHGQTNCPV